MQTRRAVFSLVCVALLTATLSPETSAHSLSGSFSGATDNFFVRPYGNGQVKCEH